MDDQQNDVVLFIPRTLVRGDVNRKQLPNTS
jgi:hypothetical protein